ncbi:MAG TPA: hypothetical protein VM555_07225 [Tahibacter sp.]|nr:hypothetical protein [Tahibacter sp.]
MIDGTGGNGQARRRIRRRRAWSRYGQAVTEPAIGTPSSTCGVTTLLVRTYRRP